MKNPITSAILRAAAELEALARLRMNQPKESVLPQPSMGVRKIVTDSPSYFDKVTWVSPEAKTASFVSRHGDLLFVVELP